MNRITKFRAKSTAGTWVEGYYCKDFAGTSYISSLDGVDTWVVEAETVCQFTSIQDINGKDIYENDILNCTITFMDGEKLIKAKFISKVSFEGGIFCIYYKGQPYQIAGAFEVIGNIDEHAHLLESEATND